MLLGSYTYEGKFPIGNLLDDILLFLFTPIIHGVELESLEQLVCCLTLPHLPQEVREVENAALTGGRISVMKMFQ